MITFQRAAWRSLILGVCGLGLLGQSQSPVQARTLPLVKVPAQAQPILPLDQIRPGMKGYGMTVFQGTKIEPFALEITSVEMTFAPNRAVIWIRCTDERMQKSGPVSGMSGSPIYLWSQGEPQVLGQGGKLIGAFAYGFHGSKECYAGVQPIEQMRRVSSRVEAGGKSTGKHAGLTGGSSRETARHIARLLVSQQGTAGADWRAESLAQALQGGEAIDLAASFAQQGPEPAPAIEPLMLPVTLNAAAAKAAGPWLREMGMMALQAPVGVPTGKLAAGVDPDNIQIEPGSVLSIPMAFGDMDFAAAGTVTDVLPDGTVLAFGHSMFGQGEAVLPASTGMVHFVQSSYQNSFKITTSANMFGTLVRDEHPAVVAQPVAKYETAPVQVTVHRPGEPARTFRYQAAMHRRLTPMVVGTVASMSLTADANLPEECTLRITGELRFEGGRKHEVLSTVPMGSATSLMLQTVPVVGAAMNNDFECVKLESAKLEVHIQPGIRSLQMIASRLETPQAAPGSDVGVFVRLQKHHGGTFEQRVRIPLPADLPEGTHKIAIVDAAGLNRLQLAAKPNRQQFRSVDDIFALMREQASVDDQALYAVLLLPGKGLALGRSELPQLPESRAAILESPTTTLATAMRDLLVVKVPVDGVPVGQQQLTVTVDKDAPR